MSQQHNKPPYDRVRGGLTPNPQVTSIWTWEQRSNGVTQPTSVQTRLTSGMGSYGKWMKDVVTPGFKQLQGQGALIITAMEKEEGSEQVLKPFSGRLTRQTYTNGDFAGWSVEGYTPDPLSSKFLPFVLPSDPEQQAMNEAIANSHQRNVMGIVDLAESEKTINLLRTQLGRLNASVERSLLKPFVTTSYKAIQKLRRSSKIDWRYVGQTAHGKAADAAGLWLETQYGIIPLMLSIEGLITALTSGNSPTFSESQTFRGRHQTVSSDRRVNTEVITAEDGSTFTDEWITGYHIEWTARAGIISTYRPSLKARLGMETRDLIPAGYELIKFSFLLDWFYDLGTYLEAVVPVSGHTNLGSWRTIVKEQTITYEHNRTNCTQGSSGDRTTFYYPINASVSHTIKVFNRLPGIRAGLPSIDLDYRSVKHVVSAVSLALSSAASRSMARI